MTRRLRRAAPLLLALAVSACASTRPAGPAAAPVTPRYPDYPTPVVPANLSAAPEIVARHERAWNRLQGGDPRGASREFNEILKRAPDFYPAQTGLGYALLAGKDFDDASEQFAAATTRNERYLPAWMGRAEAELALGHDAATIIALERIVVLDPAREDVKTRLELLQFRELQALIESGQKARQAGRHAEAIAAFQRALDRSPTSRTILNELAVTERDAGMLDLAEAHARRSLALDNRDAESYALLSTILERLGRLEEALTAIDRAVALDPRPDWRDRRDALSRIAEVARIPVEVRELPAAETVTRAQAAAYIGIHLEPLLSRSSRRVAVVVTDARNHWAASWILQVTQTGVMEVLPNHTFQPSNAIRRGDLARIVMRLIDLSPQRRADATRWRSVRPRFADLPAGNLFYPAAAFAVSAGAMAVEGDRFFHTRPATGQEFAAAIERVRQLTGR
jgi:tetratricopeptide (TPR) repeat protein